MICPICKNEKDFLPVDTRKHAMCPVCRSLERHRLMYLLFKDLFANKDLRILHVYPQYCWNWVFKDHPFYCIMRHDIQSTPFAGKNFDIVIAVHIMEHVDFESAALDEIKRILDDNGKAILPVPLQVHREKTFRLDLPYTKKEMMEKCGNPDHRRVYGQDYKELLEIFFKKVEIYDSSDLKEKGVKEKYKLLNELIHVGVKANE